MARSVALVMAVLALVGAAATAGCSNHPAAPPTAVAAPDVKAAGASRDLQGTTAHLAWSGTVRLVEGQLAVDARWEVPITADLFATLPFTLPATVTAMHAAFNWTSPTAQLGFVVLDPDGHAWCGALPSPQPSSCWQALHAPRAPSERWSIAVFGDATAPPLGDIPYTLDAWFDSAPLVILGPPAPFGQPIAFTTPVHVDDAIEGVEPSIAVTPSGRVWIAALTGLPGGLWDAKDGGVFERVDVNGLPYCDDSRLHVPPSRASHIGCGDTDVATAGESTIYFSDHWGGEGVHVSHDGGNSWTTQLLGTGADVHTDRQWLATNGDMQAWLSYDGQLGVLTGRPSVSRTVDGGLTWLNLGSVPIQAQCVTGFARDSEGRLFVADCDADGLGVGVSTDGGLTFVWHPLGTAPPNSIIPVVTTDAAGNVHVIWTAPVSGGGSQVEFASSTDHGSTWSRPKSVATGPGTFVYAWGTGGAAGHLAIAFYGTREVNEPDLVLHEWYPVLAVTGDALSSGPSWAIGAVSAEPAQFGPICLGGNGCAHGRNLGDFFQIQADHDGRVHVAWVDGTGGGDSSTGRLRYAHTVAAVLGGPSVDKNGGR